MATTTPNFGWPVPTSTDLVKDGAVAIEALGDAVDASLLDLKGGTTGQVLSKTSNTDMDFTWTTDASGISPTIVDAKGDLIAASAADTPARLAVGANGTTLVADSTTATGLRYQDPVNANPILNSAFQIAQRGTSISIAANAGYTYTLDRWCTTTGANQATTVSRQLTGDTTNLPNIQYAMRYQRNSGQTGTGALYNFNVFESVNSIPYSGKTVTLSFYARKGANYSPTSSALGVAITSGTGTDQQFFGFTGSGTPVSGTATLTTTWQRFSFSGTIASNVTQLAPYFINTPTGTAGAADYYEVTGVMLEVGSVATPFKTNGATIQGELAACQRYYWRNTPGSTGGTYGFFPAAGFCTSTSVARLVVNLPPMRVTPTVLDYGNALAVNDGPTTASTGTWTFTGSGGTPNSVALDYTHGSAIFTAYRPVQMCGNNNAAAYLGLGAEL